MVCVTRLEFDKLHSIERIELLLPLLLECLARFNRPGDGWGRVLVVGGEHFRNPGPLLLQFVRGTVTHIHVGLPGLHIRHEILLLDSALGSETGNYSSVVVLDLMIQYGFRICRSSWADSAICFLRDSRAGSIGMETAKELAGCGGLHSYYTNHCVPDGSLFGSLAVRGSRVLAFLSGRVRAVVPAYDVVFEVSVRKSLL